MYYLTIVYRICLCPSIKYRYVLYTALTHPYIPHSNYNHHIFISCTPAHTYTYTYTSSNSSGSGSGAAATGGDKQKKQKQDSVTVEVEKGAQLIVGCGFPDRGDRVDVKIVNPDTLKSVSDVSDVEGDTERDAVGVGEIWVNSPSKVEGDTERDAVFVGEIWVNSPSKAQGYYGREQQTKEEFLACISGGDENVTYVR